MWEPGQAAIAAIGQGYVTATPLQLTNAYTALANGGTLYEPRLGEALLSPSGKLVQKIVPPVIRHLPVASETLSYIRSALAGVVTQGTAAGAFAGFPLNQVCVAGKTGTAQIMGKNATSVFASFAPCNNPKLVVVVMLPELRLRRGRRRAPAVRQIWDGIYGLEGAHKKAAGGAARRRPARAAEARRRPVSVGLPSRGWAGRGRAPSRRTAGRALNRAFAKGGVAGPGTGR